MDLTHRSTLPEIMDEPSTSAEDYARCLHDLAAVNRITFTHRPTLAWLARATRDLPPGTAVSILDIACGEGDLLRAVHRWAVRHGRTVTLDRPRSEPAQRRGCRRPDSGRHGNHLAHR